MNKIKSHRNNMISDFVDINFLKKQQERERQEMRFGAFGGVRKFNNNKLHASGLSANAPLSPNSRKRIQL